MCTKSPISRLVWQIDRRCLGLPGGFRGWPIQWNHAKCCGADPGCHGNKILARDRDPVAYRLVMYSLLMDLVVVSVVDAYKSAPSGTFRSYEEPKPTVSQTTPSTCILPVENGDLERTVCSVNLAPPRKRLKRSRSSSPQDCVETKFADSVAAASHPVCAATILTPTTGVVPSLCLAQALPLSGRIIGTVWQPVQSQSTMAAVSTSSGISDFI